MTTYHVKQVDLAKDISEFTLICQTCKEEIQSSDVAAHTNTHNSQHIQIEPYWTTHNEKT